MSSKTCPDCGRIAALDAQYCQQCGHQYRTKFAPVEDRTQMNMSRHESRVKGDDIQLEPGTHSSWNAFALSMIVPFVGGQIYNRQYAKAFVHGLVSSGCIGVCAVMSPAWLLGAPFLFLFWLVCVIDSTLVAKRLKDGEAVGQWQSF